MTAEDRHFRGPRHVVKKGRTSVLDREEARALLSSIDTSTLVGLRDRALIGIMIYTFARVGAVLQMNMGDYSSQGRRGWVRLDEKGGKDHEAPCISKLEAYLDEYIAAAGGHQNPHRQSFHARHRHYRLPEERRHAGARAEHGRPLPPRTTKLYDRRNDEAALDEYEKVRI